MDAKTDPTDQLVKELETLNWVFAKTMADRPHWWVRRTPENQKLYYQLFRRCRQGKAEKFGRAIYRYYRPGDGWKYWSMTTDERSSIIINRAVDDGPQAADSEA